MNNRNYQTAIDLLNHLMAFLVSFSFIELFVLLFHRKSTLPFLFLILLAATFFSYLVRIKVKRLPAFFLWHVVCLAGAFLLLPSLPVKIAGTSYLFFLTVYEFTKRLGEEIPAKKNLSPGLLLFFPALYLVNTKLLLPGFKAHLFLFLLLFILLFLINHYLLHFEAYFTLQKDTKSIPMGQIKAANHTMIAFFIGLCVIFMILFSKLPLGALLLGVRNGILSALRWFFSLFSSGANSIDVPATENTEAPAADYGFPSPKEPSALLETLQHIFLVLLIVLTAVALISLIAYCLYKLYQSFYQKKQNYLTDTTEFLSPFEKSEKAAKKERKKSFSLFQNSFAQTNNGKIRHAFYKALSSASTKDAFPAASAAPSNYAHYLLSDKKLSQEEKETAEKQIAFLYEKARYGEEDCKKEDVKKFKQLLP